MSQNYIKSLKVDEHAWQTIYFRGSIGREPRHLAPVKHTPRQLNAPRYLTTTIRLKLHSIALYHMHGIVHHGDPCMYWEHFIVQTE